MSSKDARLYAIVICLFCLWGGLALLLGLGGESSLYAGLVLYAIGCVSVVALGNELDQRTDSKFKRAFRVAFSFLGVVFLVIGVVFALGIGIVSDFGVGVAVFALGVSFALASQRLDDEAGPNWADSVMKPIVADTESQNPSTVVDDSNRSWTTVDKWRRDLPSDDSEAIRNDEASVSANTSSTFLNNHKVFIAQLIISLGGGIALLLGIGLEANLWVGVFLYAMGLASIVALAKRVKARADTELQEKFRKGFAVSSQIFFWGGVAVLCGLGIESDPGVGGILVALGMSIFSAYQQLLVQPVKEPEANQEGFLPDYSAKVYLLKADKYYKIGVTQGPIENRVKALQTGSPFPIEVVHVIEAQNPYALEAKLHLDYASKRRQGEWFELNQSDVIQIKSIKKSE